jgi:CBS domain containing-hemolysin-like protein
MSLTFLLLLFGEVLPKVYASRNNIKFAKMVCLSCLFLILLSPISVPQESTVYLHNKLGEVKPIFHGQLSQALELTSSDETSLKTKKILIEVVTFDTDTKQVIGRG